MTIIERKDLTQRGKYEDPSIEKVYTDSSNQFIIQKHSVDQDSSFQCRLTIKRSRVRAVVQSSVNKQKHWLQLMFIVES